MTPQQNAAIEASKFVERLNDALLFPIIYLMMSLAFLVFLFGLAEYVFGAGSEQKRTEGRSHIMYGIIGLFVMVSAWGLLNIAAGTFGLDDELDCAKDPEADDCEAVFTLPGGAGGVGGDGGAEGGGVGGDGGGG